MVLKTAALSLVLALSAWAQDPKKEEEKKKDEEAKAKIAEFKKELKAAKTDGDRAFAIQQHLGQLQHTRILDELKNWLTQPNAEVMGAAAEAVAKYKSKDAADLLMKAAGARRDKDGLVKLLRYAGDTLQKPLVSRFAGFFGNKEADVAREAVDSCGKLKSRDAVDPLISLARQLDGIRDDVGQPGGVGNPGGVNLPGGAGGENEQLQRKRTVLPATYRALQNITGEKWQTVKEWEQWWRKAKATFKDPA